MTLFRESPTGTFMEYTTGEIDGVRLPPAQDMEQHWSIAELQSIGLWRSKDMIAPAEDPPDGKIIIGQTVERIDGVVQFVLTLDNIAAPTEADVIAERERRLALGFDYDFGDDRGVHRIGTTKADMAGWDEVAKLAAAKIAKGEGSATILISTDTGPVLVTALEWQDILVAAGDVRQPLYQASFVLMAMDPIPTDYADDARWL